MKRTAFLAGSGALAGSLLLSRATAFAQATPLRIVGTSADDYTAVVYAQQAGLFAAAGLDAHVEKMAGGAVVAAAVLSGSYDIGKSSITALLDAHEKGVPFTFVAPGAIYDSKAPYGGFIVAKDSPIRSGKDFNGQTVGVATLGDIGHLALSAWVEQRGGDASTIHFVEIPLATGSAAVAQGRVAAAEIGYPALATALAGGAVRLVPAFDGIANSFLITAWFTTKEFASRRPEVVRAFARVSAQGAAYANAHHTETAPMMAEFTGIPEPLIEHMTRTVIGTRFVPAQIQAVIEAAVKYKLLKRSFPARELIDPSIS